MKIYGIFQLAAILLLSCPGHTTLSHNLNDPVPQQGQTDSPETIAALLKAAEQGNAEAQSKLAFAYIQGRGVPQNYSEALKWYRKAAEQAQVDAQHGLGVMYHQGIGVPPDYSEALKWYRKAAEQGHVISLNNLGLMYATGSGVVQDYAEAVKWIRMAAEKGYVRAQSNLGKLYSQGKGVAKDSAEAVRWYRLAAEQGDPSAQYNLGIKFFEGDAVSQDHAEAAKWYRKAAEQGYVNAQHDVGVMYQQGIGVSQDYVQAYFWLNLSAAAERGKPQEETLKLLDAVSEKMTPRQLEEARRLAKEWRPKAMGQGELGAVASPETSAATPSKATPAVMVTATTRSMTASRPTLEQLSKMDSFTLGRAYQEVESTIASLEMAVKYPNVIFMFVIEGRTIKITQENVPDLLRALNEQLPVYREAIEHRGHAQIAGWHTLEANEAVAGKEGFNAITLLADAELSRNEYILAREVQIKQQGSSVQLIREMNIGREKKDLSFPGLVIGEFIVFEVPNVKIRFYGTMNGDVIELRVDLYEVKRSQSFAYAVESVTNPARTAASELNAEAFSEWLFRLKRKPSNNPAIPSPSDQLLIVTPDNKLRKTTREEVSLK